MCIPRKTSMEAEKQLPKRKNIFQTFQTSPFWVHVNFWGCQQNTLLFLYLVQALRSAESLQISSFLLVLNTLLHVYTNCVLLRQIRSDRSQQPHASLMTLSLFALAAMARLGQSKCFSTASPNPGQHQVSQTLQSTHIET